MGLVVLGSRGTARRARPVVWGEENSGGTSFGWMRHGMSGRSGLERLVGAASGGRRWTVSLGGAGRSWTVKSVGDVDGWVRFVEYPHVNIHVRVSGVYPGPMPAFASLNISHKLA